MDTWALAGAIKYGPKDATMTKNAKIILTDLWADIAAHYNPYLVNMVGPVCFSLNAYYSRPANRIISNSMIGPTHAI
jgi:hypothetical protein